MEKRFLSNSDSETEAIGADLAKELSHGDFLAFYGDLGAGKTAFIRGLVHALIPDAPVQSPTYTIVNEYHSKDYRICHCDMYRIETEDDLESIGFFDYTDCIIAAEWSEKIPFAIPDSHYRITILKKNETQREITIKKQEARQ